MYAAYWLIRVVRPDGMGGGDVKLAGPMGGVLAWLSWSVLLVGGVFLLMARLLRHVSLHQVLIASLLLAMLRWILLGTLADHWLWLLLAQLLHAATFGSFHSVCVLVVRGSFNV